MNDFAVSDPKVDACLKTPADKFSMITYAYTF